MKGFIASHNGLSFHQTNIIFNLLADYDEKSCLSENNYKFGLLYQVRGNLIYYKIKFVKKILSIKLQDIFKYGFETVDIRRIRTGSRPY